MHPLKKIVSEQKAGNPKGIYSCCSANEYVLRAALERGKLHNTPVLIESTANQVDQFGGYTGMTPQNFFEYVISLSKKIGLRPELLILGGDHLGPLTFAKQGEAEAMEKACELVRQYVLAGFTKIHIDTSMKVADDDAKERLSDKTIARRGAMLCEVAEKAYAQRKAQDASAVAPLYVIGSEVPIPGGAQEAEDGVSVTTPEDLRTTIAVFKDAFYAKNLQDAWERVVGVVVQPGVEFGDADVFEYDSQKAKALTAVLREYPNFVLEGHSTDYQTKQGLKQMVADGIAILKVGPALTFALREGLFALECMEKELLRGSGIALSELRATMEYAMMKNPDNWKKHYHGDGVAQAYARAFSFSDRARYYLPDPLVEAAIQRLLKNLADVTIPYTILSQYMPVQYTKMREGIIPNTPIALLKDRVGDCIDEYLYATI